MFGVSQKNQGFADLCRRITWHLKRQPVKRLTNAQVHAFGVDPDQLCRLGVRQARQFDVVGDGFGVIGVHVLDHAHLSLAGERIGQRQLINPMNRAEATDVTVPHGFEHPEIEIVGLVVALRLREIAVVTLGGRFDRGLVFELFCFGEISQATNGLHIVGLTFAHKKRAFRIFLQVMGVLGDAADKDQRPTLLVQAIRNHGAKRETGHRLGVRRQHPAVFLEKQFSGILGRFNAQFMTPYIESVEKTDRLLEKVPAMPSGAILMCSLATQGADREAPYEETTSTCNWGMRMQLTDKVIIITGGCQGLGRSMAEYFASKGAKLALVDLNQEKLDAAVAACKAKGVEARAYLCNVANEEQVCHMVSQVAEDFGAIHGLINNAGILRDGLLLKIKDGEMSKMSLAQWQAVIDVNLTGVFLCTREVAAKMIELKSSGAIINISSISRAGNVGQTNYSAAKAGVAAATVTWAKELARYGIRVAGIAPGFIETEMTLGMKPEALEKMTSGIPLKRMGKPEEIAHSAAYIFENDYYTGRILEMDGGLRI